MGRDEGAAERTVFEASGDGELQPVVATGMTAVFLEQFEVAVGGSRIRLPTHVIGAWEFFVDSCEEGYDDILDEFINDRYVRLLIDRLLQNEQLHAFPEMQWVEQEIHALDDRYRALLLDEPVLATPHWWEARLPRYGGAQFAAEIQDLYGMTIEIR